MKMSRPSDGILPNMPRLMSDFTTTELEMMKHGPHADGLLMMKTYQSGIDTQMLVTNQFATPLKL